MATTANAVTSTTTQPANNRDSVFHEIGYWLLYGLVLALAQLWLAFLASYLFKKNFSLVDLIGNGSLLFFATTTASKTAGDYMRKVKSHHPTAKLICFGVLLLILLPSVFAYACEVVSRLGGPNALAMSPERVTTFSLWLAFGGALFSFSYTLIIRAYGD
jgi:hypothetical protein